MERLKQAYNRLRSFLLYHALLFVNYIILLAWLTKLEVDFKTLFYLFISYLLTGVSAYLINDFFDKEIDSKAGKSNITTSLSSKLIFVLVLVGFSLSFLFIYNISELASFFLCIQFIALLVYSHPITRLKTKPIFGILLDSFYAYLIPVLLLYSVFDVEIVSWKFFCFLLFNFTVGLRDIILHQKEDYFNDLDSGTDSFVTRYKKKAILVIHVLEVVSGVSVACFFILCSDNVDYEYSVVAALVICSYFILLQLINIQKAVKNNLLMQFYIVVSSIVLGCWIWEDGNYWMLLFLIHPYLLQFLTFLIQLLNQIKIVLSVIVNYSLYYCFKIFGRDLRRRPLFKKND
ncbi:MAG: hypothetical protein ACI9DK_000090 [Vicingaceae bacterium]|jgi:hypothetical protein